MSKVIDLPNVTDWLNRATEDIEQGTPVLICYKASNDEVVTGWWKATMMQRQEMISHLQIDVIMGVVQENLRG